LNHWSKRRLEGKSKAKAKAVKAKIPLPGGESIPPFGEIELILSKGEVKEIVGRRYG